MAFETLDSPRSKNGWGGRRAGAGRPRGSKNKTRRKIKQLPTLADPQVIRILTRIEAGVRRLDERDRDEREAVQPMLRRLTEIERILKLTSMHVPGPPPTRRNPLR